MAHGENAERHGRPDREYWSSRWRTWSWGAYAKRMTHRRERRDSVRVVRSEKLDVQKQ